MTKSSLGKEQFLLSYSSRGTRVEVRTYSSHNSRQSNRGGKWRSHFLDHRHEAEGELEVAWVFYLPKPLSSNTLPTVLYLLNAPDLQAPATGDGQVLEYTHLEEIFSFKSLQPLNTNTLRKNKLQPSHKNGL